MPDKNYKAHAYAYQASPSQARLEVTTSTNPYRSRHACLVPVELGMHLRKGDHRRRHRPAGHAQPARPAAAGHRRLRRPGTRRVSTGRRCVHRVAARRGHMGRDHLAGVVNPRSRLPSGSCHDECRDERGRADLRRSRAGERMSDPAATIETRVWRALSVFGWSRPGGRGVVPRQVAMAPRSRGTDGPVRYQLGCLLLPGRPSTG
jgi:hypothetical protein